MCCTDRNTKLNISAVLHRNCLLCIKTKIIHSFSRLSIQYAVPQCSKYFVRLTVDANATLHEQL